MFIVVPRGLTRLLWHSIKEPALIYLRSWMRRPRLVPKIFSDVRAWDRHLQLLSGYLHRWEGLTASMVAVIRSKTTSYGHTILMIDQNRMMVCGHSNLYKRFAYALCGSGAKKFSRWQPLGSRRARRIPFLTPRLGASIFDCLLAATKQRPPTFDFVGARETLKSYRLASWGAGGGTSKNCWAAELSFPGTLEVVG